MKNIIVSCIVISLSFLSFPTFSQNENDQEMLGLPGDNLDLFAVLDLFQKSKTIEDFEKSLNSEETGINNLDLNNDEKIDFIKVETVKNEEDFMFILRNPINDKETQDVAVIHVSKDKAGKVTIQIVGDKDLYGKDYIVQPNTEATPSITANPTYTGDNPVATNVPAKTTVVVVEAAPVVQYVYSPAYVPYYPPYYYGYYPPYYRAVAITAVAIYRHNHYYHHRGYHNTVVIHNRNYHNHYNNNVRHHSNTVNNNINYRNSSTSGKGSYKRASTTQTGRATTGNRSANRPSSSQYGNTSTRASGTNRASSGTYSSGSRSRSNYSSGASRSSSMGATRSGGGGRRRY